jgi:nitrite reductase/ring-hydroxylating ferredoxin subunit
LVIEATAAAAADGEKHARFARGLDLAHCRVARPPEALDVSDTNGLVSRRRFCAGACQIASCATLATLASACGDGSTSTPTSPSSSGGGASMLPVLAGRFTTGASVVQVNTAGTALNDVGAAALVESTAGLFLIARTGEGTFQAVDGVCTHEGCTINSIDGTTYVCPCHGSRYNRGGQVLAGPAGSSLRQYATTFADGVVSIRL